MIWVIGILALLAMGVGAGWEAGTRWDEHKVTEVTEAWQKEKDAMQKEVDQQKARADEIAGRFEDKLSKLRIVNTTINREVRHETEKTVYGDPNCDVPASGVLLLNDSIRAANRAAGYVSGEVPAPAGTSGGTGDDGGVVHPK